MTLTAWVGHKQSMTYPCLIGVQRVYKLWCGQAALPTAGRMESLCSCRLYSCQMLK